MIVYFCPGTVYRIHRNCHGGGVLIAVWSSFPSVACQEYGRADIEV